jgi:mono/diheme cytochrome c family protein
MYSIEKPRPVIAMRRILLEVTALVLLLAATAQAAEHRWYSSQQVTSGESVYRQNCIACHLENGAGTENWQTRDADGKLLPPPLNGTAHTWHHDLGVLARTIVEGGTKLGGSMPAFGDRLSTEEIAAVIAYVQSLWPDEIYQRWSGAYPEDAAGGHRW